MKEILSIYLEYQGSGYVAILFPAALIYLLITEKNKTVRRICLYPTAILQLLFFLPVFQKLISAFIDKETYYRLLWMLPMAVIIAYAGVRLFGRRKRIGLVVISAVIILTGSYVYSNVHITKAQNRYKLPNEVIWICDYIDPEEGRIWAAFPSELIHYVRQYTTDIMMPYGREMLVASWDEYTPHPLYVAMEAAEPDTEELAALADEYDCQYLIINSAKKLIGDPAAHGLIPETEIGGYTVYSVVV